MFAGKFFWIELKIRRFRIEIIKTIIEFLNNYIINITDQFQSRKAKYATIETRHIYTCMYFAVA